MPADDTPNLLLPYILPAQAQKHVTHNEAIRALDALVQLSVVDRNLAAPPVSPPDGARYIVAASATGAWTGQSNTVAAWQDGAWAFYTPREGWVAWVADEDVLVAWNGSAWVAASSGGGPGVASLNPATGGLVGVNTVANTTNRLAVASPASLFDHAGAGHQQKINKAAAANTASQLYQTNFSGRAEIGLIGDDDFRFKVSADGSTWRDAIIINRASGVVALPFTALTVNPNLLANGDFSNNQRLFAFGALADGVYGVDRWKAVGATDIGWTASTLTLTLNAGAIRQVVEPAFWGYPNLASQQVTVSVEGLTGGNLTVAVGSASGVITAGSGRRSVTLTLGAGDTGNLNVTLTPSAYPTWWKRTKLEVGAAATAWEARDAGHELRLCQRYFYRRDRSGQYDVLFMVSFFNSAQAWGGSMHLPTTMRANPTVSFSAPGDFSLYVNSQMPCTALSNIVATRDFVSLRGGATASGTATVGQAGMFYFTNAPNNGWLAFDAEL